MPPTGISEVDEPFFPADVMQIICLCCALQQEKKQDNPAIHKMFL